MRRSLFLFFLLLCCYRPGFARFNNIDSLERVVNAMPADTARVAKLCQLSQKLAADDLPRAMRHAQAALQLSEQLNFTQGKARSLSTLGQVFRMHGQYDSAMHYFEQGLVLSRKINDKPMIITALNGIGIVNSFRGDHEKSISHLMEALRISEAINDKPHIQSLLNNIAVIYNGQQNFKQSIRFFEQALKMQQEAGSKKAISSTFNNMAIAYTGLGDTVRALSLYEQSLAIKRELGDQSGIALLLSNLAGTYTDLKQYKKSGVLLAEALDIQTRIDDKHGIASTLQGLGTVHQKQGNNQEAVEYYTEALRTFEELQAKEDIKKLYQYLAESHAAQGNYKLSAEYYAKQVALSEKLFSENNAKQIAEMQARYETEKKEKTISLLTKEKELEHVQSKLVRNSLLGGMTLLGGLLLAAFVAYRQKQKTNHRISQKNEQLHLQKIELEQQQEEILAQRDNIEAKNRVLEQAYEEINRQKNEITEKNTELEQQQEEILAQRDNIEAKNHALEQVNTEIVAQRNELEKAYDNIKILSEIGQQITAILDVKTIVETVHQHITRLMDVAGFGIGLYSNKTGSISFENFIEDGMVLPLHQHRLDDQNNFASWCLREQQVVFINDVEKEYHHFISSPPEVVAGQATQSLIYVPLTIESRRIGVITVQSSRKNAYENYHLSILQTLGSYIAIALDNANAYRVIETKNTHITDSIRYAQTIQQAILPAHERIAAVFSDFFVLYQPRDVVSGDFYWFHHTETRTLIAAIDCTGHGVPGAFMSLIGNTILNKIVSASPGISPADLLEQLHAEIRMALRQDSSSNDDGMDVCMVAIDHSQEIQPASVTFAGARRPLYTLDATGVISEIKGNNRSIGGRQRETYQHFTNHTLQLQVGECLYLTTDGLMDQNNGNKERFGSQRFRMLLEQMAGHTMAAQRELLQVQLQAFQQQQEQRDDITVLGIRL